MAQATILASGTTAATSTDIVLADGASKTVGMFGAGAIGSIGFLRVMIDTPGADLQIATLTPRNPVVVISGPGTFRVVRPLVSSAVGVFTEG